VLKIQTQCVVRQRCEPVNYSEKIWQKLFGKEDLSNTY